MWWQRWPPLPSRIKRERRPQWLRSAQESVAGSAAAADSKKKQGRGGGTGGNGGSGQQASHTLTHAEQARVGSGLCFRHFCFGAKASKCEAPCNWSGN